MICELGLNRIEPNQGESQPNSNRIESNQAESQPNRITTESNTKHANRIESQTESQTNQNRKPNPRPKPLCSSPPFVRVHALFKSTLCSSPRFREARPLSRSKTPQEADPSRSKTPKRMLSQMIILASHRTLYACSSKRYLEKTHL